MSVVRMARGGGTRVRASHARATVESILATNRRLGVLADDSSARWSGSH
ncbi:hypothetical protein [Natrinema longum]|nr:hypothetical protein [Natrinema longum]MBZ6496583.1 hypothetical protein [Natrinema longum]